MGKVIKIILKILLVFILVGALVAGDYWLVRHYQWPLWYGGALLFLIFGVVIGFFFVRRVLLKARSKEFVKQVVKQEEATADGKIVEKKIRLDAIQGAFNRAVETIRHSRLKRIGDPIYVLPWYMMIGEPGSGKTTALRNCGLTSSFPEFSQDTGPAGTQYFNFWFYKQAIVLDVAGRFCVSVYEGKDREEEWQDFLAQLVKHRRKEPLNGLIVSVPADKLLHSSKSAIEDYGRDIRARINQVMRTIGAKFPIYIMVTKADLIPGMGPFSDLLPQGALKQALGYINSDPDRSSKEFLDEAIKSITERLKDLRLLVLYHHEGADPNVLLLPEEMPKIREGLGPFIKVIFLESPYQEPPMLRGLYFGSGLHERPQPPDMLQSAEEGAHPPKQSDSKPMLSVFMRDFFSQVIPADRGLPTPTREFMSWRRHTRTLGISSWLMICIAMLALLTMSFLKNMSEIKDFADSYKRLPAISNSSRIFDNLFVLNDFLKAVLDLENKNKHWIVPRMGLYQSLQMEAYLKKVYLNKYKPVLFSKTNKDLFDKIDKFDNATPDSLIGDYVEHLAKRINIHLAVIRGKSMDDIKKMPGPFDEFIPFVDKDLVATAGPVVNQLYIYWVYWQSVPEWLRVRRQELQLMLLHLLDVKGDNARWVVAWANNKSDASPVTLEQFWSAKEAQAQSSGKSSGIAVKPAFTTKGREHINELFDMVQQALSDYVNVKEVKARFDLWYGSEYISAWQSFGQSFYSEAMSLSAISRPEFHEEESPFWTKALDWSIADWQALGMNMTTPTNPFFQLLDKMAVELEPVKDTPGAPRWLTLLVNFHIMKGQAESKTFWQQTISIAQGTQAGGGLVEGSGVTKEFSIKNPSFPLDVHLKAIKGFQDYQAALAGLAPVLTSTDRSYQMVQQLYKALADPTIQPTPFDNANTAIGQLKLLISANQRDEKIFWDLFQGPVDFMLYYLLINTACTLQHDWEGKVLSALPSIPDSKLENELFGQTGIVWKFIHSEIDPFISRNEKGYYSMTYHNSQIPFNPTFFTFINRGQRASLAIEPEYNVIIKTLPIDINPEAQEKPSGVILKLNCTDGVQRLENYNFPLIKSFKWTPGSCGDVQLDIILRDTVFSKKYAGYRGFPGFLVDFTDGEKTFVPEDFPDQAEAMEKLSIKRIQVRYEFRGQGPVMKLNEQIPTDVPRKITWCLE